MPSVSFEGVKVLVISLGLDVDIAPSSDCVPSHSLIWTCESARSTVAEMVEPLRATVKSSSDLLEEESWAFEDLSEIKDHSDMVRDCDCSFFANHLHQQQLKIVQILNFRYRRERGREEVEYNLQICLKFPV
jgi:hypothetical protein